MIDATISLNRLVAYVGWAASVVALVVGGVLGLDILGFVGIWFALVAVTSTVRGWFARTMQVVRFTRQDDRPAENVAQFR